MKEFADMYEKYANCDSWNEITFHRLQKLRCKYMLVNFGD